jgi:hypothetical protein
VRSLVVVGIQINRTISRQEIADPALFRSDRKLPDAHFSESSGLPMATETTPMEMILSERRETGRHSHDWKQLYR